MNDLYSGSLYLTGWNPSDNASCYRWYIKNKKLKKLAASSYAERYGKYILLDDTLTMGSFFLFHLRVYDTAKQKLTTLTSKCGGWSRSGSTIYFAQKTGGNYNNYTYKIRSYSLSSRKYKTIKTGFKAFNVGKITSKYIYYTTNGGGKCYRYTIKTKKKAAMSFTAYAKAVGA